MSITVHQRPGVYSDYDVSALIHGSGRGSVVGLAAVCDQAEKGKVWVVTGQQQAEALFGAEHCLSVLSALALRNGAGAVACTAVAEEGGYEEACELLCAREDVSVMLCGSTELAVQEKLRDCVLEASASRRECIGIAAGVGGENVDALIERAAAINSERMVLVGAGAVEGVSDELAGLKLAAAVAGAVAGQKDPAIPLGGAALKGVSGLAGICRDADLDRMILGGVTPVEQMGGAVSVVRGVTTRTTTDGVSDPTWRDLCTVLVIDTVIPALRSSLKNKFRRAKNTPRGRGAIRAQVVLELENFLAKEIITAYDGVKVTADEEDPTRALVDFSFTVAHGLNQIWLSAHITV